MQRIYDALAQFGSPTHPYYNRTALVEGNIRWTFGELWSHIETLAYGIRERFQPGDCVALMLWNQKEFLWAFFALRRAGVVVLPMNLQLPPEDMAYVLGHAQVKGLIISPDLFEKLAPALSALKPSPENSENTLPFSVFLTHTMESSEAFQGFLIEKGWDRWSPLQAFDTLTHSQQSETCFSQGDGANTLGILLYTSGTTGLPKGVMLSEANLLANLEGVQTILGFQSSDRFLLALPLFHAFGLINALYPLSMGSMVVLVPKFAPKSLIRAVAQEQVTVMPLVPTMFGLLLELAKSMGTEPFQTLRACVSGGAGLAPELKHRIESTLNLQVLEGYGLTETSPVIAVHSLQDTDTTGTVGRPLGNLELKLVTDEGKTIPKPEPGSPSLEGEIVVRGPSVMLGYYRDPEATRAVLDQEGWFATGDLGHLNINGHLVISGGRKKDLIIKAGENIAPLRIEQVLYQHPAILEASVIGVPDPKLGEAILACVQIKQDHPVTIKDLQTFCKNHLPPFYLPDGFRLYDELPKTVSGKILKKTLRQENPVLPQLV